MPIFNDQKVLKEINSYQEQIAKKKESIRSEPCAFRHRELRFEETLIMDNTIKMILPVGFLTGEADNKIHRVMVDELEFDTIHDSLITYKDLPIRVFCSQMSLEQNIALNDINDIFYKKYITDCELCKFLKEGTLGKANETICYFTYREILSTGNQFNIFFFTFCYNNLLVGKMNCDNSVSGLWEDYFIQMLTTVGTV